MKRALLVGFLGASTALPAHALTGFSLVTPTLNLNFGGASASVPVVLPATTKDPYLAYNLGSVPLVGSFYASNYVGMNPLRAEPEIALQKAARNHFLTDLVWILGGTFLPTAMGRDWRASEMALGASAGLGLSLLTRLWAFAPYWGREAVRFNETQYKAFSYAPWYAPKAEKDAPKAQTVTPPIAP